MDKKKTIGLIEALMLVAGIGVGYLAHSTGLYGYAPVISQPYYQTTTSTNLANSILPQRNKSYDLGSSILSWRNVYASGISVNDSNVCLANGTNCPSNYSSLTITNLTFTNATGSWLNLNTGGNIQVAGANPYRTMVLTAAGCWPSFTAGATTNTQSETVTNLEDYRFVGFDATTTQYCQWTVVMPSNYDGGALLGSVNFTVTTTAVTASSTTWGLQGACTSTGGNMDMNWGTAVSSAKQLTATNRLHTTSEFSFTPSAPAGGSVCQFRVFRSAANSNDDYGNMAAFISAKVRYGINAFSD